MFSTPLICSSMGATTVDATISALAPGYWPCTLMIGGAISGYCATGKRANETAPRITKMMETTEAKIGRSMKKWEIRIPVSIALRLGAARSRGGFPLFLRANLAARTGPNHSIDDHAIVGREPGLDDPQVIVEFTERDVFLAHAVVGPDHQHVFARLLGADGGVGHEQRFVRGRCRKLHAGKHARREQIVGIGELGTAADGTGGTVDHVVDEVHAAAMHERLLVDELERDRGRGPVLAVMILFGQALVAQERCFVEAELEADRVGRHDGGEQRGRPRAGGRASGNQVSRRDRPVTGARSSVN